MAERRYLVDTSVLARAAIEAVGARVESLARAGRCWTGRTVDLEVVYASLSRDVGEVIEERLALPAAPVTPAVMDRALHLAG